MKHNKIILLGGSGFVGRHLAVELAQRGYQVTLPCRRPHRLAAMKTLATINIVQEDITNQQTLDKLCQGHDVVFNLVGVLNENKNNRFRKMHIDFVKMVVDASQANAIKRVLHVSALGANQASGSSLYLRSKGEGENLLHTYGQNKLQVTSFQPSVIFGEDDSFINRFASLIKLSPGILPLACPDSRFSPVYIGDAVSIMADKIDDRQSFSKRFPLCGPETFTLRQIVKLISQAMHRRCHVVGLPDTLARLQALVLQNLPGQIFTMDNYHSLQTASICAEDSQPCPTGLTNYLNGLSHQFNRNPGYDEYRKQLNR